MVASTKQPLQWKNFDRIEISDDYESYLDTYGTFEENGGPPETGDIEFTITFYNPSTHTIRKSFNPNHSYVITMGTDTLGNTGSGWSKKDPYIYQGASLTLNNLDYGDVREIYCTPSLVNIDSHYSHTVNPFEQNWYSDDNDVPEDRSLLPYENYDHDTYTYKYEVQFRRRCGTGGPRTGSNRMSNRMVLRRIPYYIEYKIR